MNKRSIIRNAQKAHKKGNSFPLGMAIAQFGQEAVQDVLMTKKAKERVKAQEKNNEG